MTFDPKIPYDNLPPVPSAATLETMRVRKRCLAATRALGELKGAGELIPDQTILINAIPLQEAKLSSEIENIVTTQDELFRAALDEKRPTDPQTKEVLRYRTALRHGFDSVTAGKFSVTLLEDICRELRNETVSFRAEGEQVYIGNRLTGTITYTPSRGGKGLRDKLDELDRFLNSADGPDPLIRMAAAHYQIEAIHPFIDGNGRTGRIFNILYLIHSGLLNIPVLYLSRFIIQHKSDYYRLLRGVTEDGDWESWLLFMLQGVEETALWTTARIRAIRDLFERTTEHCRRELPKIYSKELIELIFRQPYCKIPFVVEAGIAQRQTAAVYLQRLESIGLLKSEKRGRDVIYTNPDLIKVLTE
jgi:Fic family protein